ncbi:MAG: DUF364 domain-containing protein [Anaerolineales bacterium]|jgi:hypothetical protein
MQILEQILEQLPDGRLTNICIGLHWTLVQAEVEGKLQMGLASTLEGVHDHKAPNVPQAGSLLSLDGLALARKVLDSQGPMASVAMATVNALMTRRPDKWVDVNAEEVIADHGAGKKVALVGHFPFTDRLRPRVSQLIVLEQHPQEGEFPPESAPDIIPQSDVVAITSMTFTNGTLDGLLNLCRPDALVILLGPTTPLSPLLFDHGVNILAGSIVEKPEPVLQALKQGGNFRQLHHAGVRLVTMRQEAR